MARPKKTVTSLQDLVPEDVFDPEGNGGEDENDHGGEYQFVPKTVNVKTRAEAEARVDQLAEAAARGEDALPTLALEIAQWAHQGTIKSKAPGKKDPEDTPDDVRDLYLRYAATRRVNAVNKGETAAKRSTDGQVSKLRIFAKVGERQDLNASDFFTNVIERRNAFDADGIATKGAYIAMQDAGKAIGYTSDKTSLTEDEYKKAILKPAKSERTALSVYKAIAANIKTLIDDQLDNSPEVHRMQSEVIDKIDFFDKLAKFTSLVASGDAERYGYKIEALAKPDDQPNSADEVIENFREAIRE